MNELEKAIADKLRKEGTPRPTIQAPKVEGAAKATRHARLVAEFAKQHLKK